MKALPACLDIIKKMKAKATNAYSESFRSDALFERGDGEKTGWR